jgi:IMP dehydrogenase
MASLISPQMCDQILKSGGLAINHRFQDVRNQLEIFLYMKQIYGDAFAAEHYGISIGVKPEELDNVREFVSIGGRVVCLDVAHADSIQAHEMLQALRKLPGRSNMVVIAGNVATAGGMRRLFDQGADVCKLNIGSGSICSTRIQTGNGVPSFTMLLEMNDYIRANEFLIVDGGLKNSGDITKALCLSHAVMAGNIFAGCEECPGKIVEQDGKRYKSYQGSSTHKTKNIEGVKTLMRVKGSYASILDELRQGIRSGCSYQGAHSLIELREEPEFVKITQASRVESAPHSFDKLIG